MPPRRGTLVLAFALLLSGCWITQAQALSTSFVVMDGPRAGEFVHINPDGKSLFGDGVAAPQAGGCNYRFEGNVHGTDVDACIVQQDRLTPVYELLAGAIASEATALRVLQGDPNDERVKDASGDLRTALTKLTQWGGAINSETSASLQIDLTAKQSAVSGQDTDAKGKVDAAKHASGADRANLINDARDLISAALDTKRQAFAELLTAVPIAGEVSTDEESLPAPTVLTDGAGLALDGTSNLDVAGARNFGLGTSQAFLWSDGAAANIDDFLPPSSANAFGPNSTVMGQSGGKPLSWDEIGEIAKALTVEPGSVEAANAFGGVGFTIHNGDERATIFKENFDGADMRFKLSRPGAIPPGSSFFAVNDNNVMGGDFFNNGSSGRFTGFLFDQSDDDPFRELFTPSGGSSQPIVVNDLGVAAGGVVNSDSSVEAALWYGKKHYLPFSSFGQPSLINGMNDAGTGVGQVGLGASADGAIFQGGQVLLVDDLIPGGSGFDVTKLFDIDNAGNMVGTAKVGGQDKAVLIRGGRPQVENDIQLVKTVEDGTGAQHNIFKSGRTVHFKLVFTNHGPQPAKQVKVVDHIPEHCKFDRVELEPAKWEKNATVFKPDKGENGGDVSVSPHSAIKVGETITIHIRCTASVTAETTFTNRSEVTTSPTQKEPASDPHPNTLDATYILKP